MNHLGRYSKVSHGSPPPSTSSTPPNGYYPKSKDSVVYSPPSARKPDFRVVARTLWPLMVYCLAALGIAGFMGALDGRQFNLTERRPLVTFPNGTTARSGGFSPLQTDATTILSILLSIFRWLLAIWVGALGWYILFYLLDMNGLSHRDIYNMITWGSLRPGTYFRDRRILAVGTILMLTICAQFSAPLVTGSITWTPSNREATLSINPSIDVAMAVESAEWTFHNNETSWRERVAVQAAGLATVAWGRDIEHGILKRTLPSAANFEINSTVANVTLPYFSITSFQWIEDPDNTLPLNQLNVPETVAPILSTRNNSNPLIVPGSVAFIPEEGWTLPLDFAEKPFPAPSIANESRIMVAYLSFQRDNPDCSDDSKMFKRPGPASPVKYHRYRSVCYAFARVSYLAGATTCVRCRISSSSTVQSDIDQGLSVQPDPMTYEALRLLPDVMGNLILMNSSIPSNWEKFEEYTTSVLVRAYSGSWMALAERTSRWVDNGTLSTVVSPKVAASRADVDLRRVAVWFFIHMFVTVLGACFFVIQSWSTHPLTGDTGMVPFYLDTSQVTKPDKPNALLANEDLKVVPADGHWKIVRGEKLN